MLILVEKVVIFLMLWLSDLLNFIVYVDVMKKYFVIFKIYMYIGIKLCKRNVYSSIFSDSNYI